MSLGGGLGGIGGIGGLGGLSGLNKPKASKVDPKMIQATVEKMPKELLSFEILS